MGEQIVLRLHAPESLVSLADAVQLSVNRVRLTLLAEVGNSGQRHIDVGVDKLLSARNRRQVEGCLDDSVQTSDVGHQTCRIHTLAHQMQSLFHIIGIAAARANYVSRSIVDIVEIEGSLEVGPSGT